jgi:hypothetical protein
MPLVPKNYNRNTKDPKFYIYSTAEGSEGYNPETTMYYNAADELVRIEEVWRGVKHSQTISGTTYSGQWPSYSYSITYSAWVETTVS